MAAGPAGSLATPALYRQHETIPSRGPLAALTVPGAVGGWMLAIEAARAVGGRGLPLDVLLHAAIGQARDGYVVAKSQARLTTEKLAELKNVPGFAETFLPDGKPPEAGTKLKQSALAFTLDHLARNGLQDFYRGDVGREIAADLEKIGSPVTRDDLRHYHASIAEPLSVKLNAGTIYNTPPPTQGLGLAHHPRAVRAPARPRGRELRVRPWPGRGDQARLPRARPRRHRSGAGPAAAVAIPRSEIPRRRGSQDRCPQGGEMAGALLAKATPSGWARPTPPGSRCPTSSRSIGSSARAACCPRPAC